MTHAWRPLTAAALRCLPASLRPWLGDCGSLTAALRRTLGEALECSLQAQGWRRATADEAARLGVAAGGALFWRRVRFSHAGRALLIGHTLVPPATLARMPAVRRLGNRPVGDLLFADPTARRQRIDVARPAPGDAAGRPVVAARRSVVLLQHRPLLVVEHFLPAMAHLGACEFFKLPSRPGMAGRESSTQGLDSREHVRACTGRARQEMHRTCISSQTVGPPPCS